MLLKLSYFLFPCILFQSHLIHISALLTKSHQRCIKGTGNHAYLQQRLLKAVKKSSVGEWAMSPSRTLQLSTQLLMDTLAVAGIKPVTFWLQDSLNNHQATRVEKRSKRSIDRLPPAACIIRKQLCEALDVHRSWWENTEEEYHSFVVRVWGSWRGVGEENFKANQGD